MIIKIQKKHLTISIVIFAIIIVVLFAFLSIRNQQQMISVTSCLPAFRDGGGPYYLANAPFRTKLVPDTNAGRPLKVTGRLLNEDCTRAIGNAVIDIWQADETGEYQDDWYRGQIRTDEFGNYSFETVLPKGYGEGTGYRPPHIHFKVHIDGEEAVTSQMFFSDVQGRQGFNDEYIIPLEVRDNTSYGEYNIVLPDVK